MMIFMMGSMGHHHMSGSDEQPGSGGSTPSDLPDMAGLSRDQRVWALRNELTRMAWRQEALRQTLEQVEAEQKTDRVVDAEPTTTSH